MSIKVTLYVDDKEFYVLDFFFGFFQDSDYTGRPNSKPNAYPFKFTIEASKDNTFYEWAIHPTMQKRQVKIEFSPVNGMSESTTIELLDVHCSYCNYHFKATGSQPFVVNFDLLPATIIRDGVVLMKRYWAVTDPTMLNQKPTIVEEDEPKILEAFWMDEYMENIIDRSIFTKKATLVVKTANIDEGESVQLKIRRKDNQLLGGKKYIVYWGVVNDEGQAEMEPLELDENWIKTNQDYE